MEAIMKKIHFFSLGLVLLLLVGKVGQAQDSLNVHQVGQMSFAANYIKAKDVVFSGDYAYLAAAGGGMMVVNISDPTQPWAVAHCYVFPTAWPNYGCIALSDSYAYVGDWEQGMGIINISDPNAPIAMGYCQVQICYVTSDIAVRGNYAYAVWWTEDRDQYFGLKVIDISNPSNPTGVGFLYMPDYAMGVAVRDTLVYVADDWSGGLRIVNVSDPTNPVEIGSCQTPDYALDVVVDGNYAYVADDWGGLRIIDISDPTAPREVGFYDTPGDAQHVAIDGHCAVVADYESGFYVIDVTYPDDPRLLGYYDTPGMCYSVAIDGGLVYAADYDYFGIYDISEVHSTSPNLKTSTPVEFVLYPCYPNPFNPSTAIRFSLPHTGHAKLIIYDVTGRQVKVLTNEVLNAGEHRLTFNGSSLSSGVYFIRLEAGHHMQTEKLILLK
jgi:hypothetical protein